MDWVAPGVPRARSPAPVDSKEGRGPAGTQSRLLFQTQGVSAQDPPKGGSGVPPPTRGGGVPLFVVNGFFCFIRKRGFLFLFFSFTVPHFSHLNISTPFPPVSMPSLTEGHPVLFPQRWRTISHRVRNLNESGGQHFYHRKHICNVNILGKKINIFF